MSPKRKRNDHVQMDEPQFKKFRELPPELRYKIWHFAVAKNSVHFFLVHKVDLKAHDAVPQWHIKLRVTPKGQDDSMHRYREVIMQLSREEKKKKNGEKEEHTEQDAEPNKRPQIIDPQADIAARHSVEKPGPLIPSWKFLPKVDFANDIVCFDFPRGTRRGEQVDTFHWARHQSLLSTDLTGYNKVVETLKDYKRVALVVSHGMSACYSGAGTKMTPFACWCGPRFPAHAAMKMCPFEVAGFLDCFASLEEVYIIYRPAKRAAINKVTKKLMVKEKPLFFSAAKHYWLIPESCQHRYLGVLLDQTRARFTRSDFIQGLPTPSRRSLLGQARRESIPFHCLLEA